MLKLDITAMKCNIATVWEVIAVKERENVSNVNSRNWLKLCIIVVINYLILGIGGLIIFNYFSLVALLVPLISFGVNYYFAKDRYELYFLNSSLVIFTIVIFIIALLDNRDVEQSAFAMLFSLVGIFELSIITVIVNKIKKRISKGEMLSESDEEKVKLGMLGIKILLCMVLVVFLVFFI